MSAIPERITKLLKDLDYLHYPSKETKGVIRELREEIKALAQLKHDAEEGLLLALGIKDAGDDERSMTHPHNCPDRAVMIRGMTFDPIKLRRDSKLEPTDQVGIWLCIGGCNVRIYAGTAKYAHNNSREMMGHRDRMVLEVQFDTPQKRGVYSPRCDKPNEEAWIFISEDRTPASASYNQNWRWIP